MRFFTKFASDDSPIDDLQQTDDPITKVGKSLRIYIPVEVTTFYLAFFGLAGAAQDRNTKELAQYVLLPILGLLLTVILGMAKFEDRKSKKNLWQRVKWGSVLVASVAFIGWVYITGGHFFDVVIEPIIAAIVFAAVSILLPIVYGWIQKPEAPPS